MAWNPISGTFIQYSEDDVDASGFYLKFYASGTVTPISMADDSTGGTLLAKCALDSDGMPINGSGAPFIPHIDQQYKIVIYRNATDADADTIANAYKEIDELYPSLSSVTEATSGIVYSTVALAKAATLTDGKLVDTKGYTVAGDSGAATYLVKTVAAYAATPDGYSDHATDDGDFVLVLQIGGVINAIQFGASPDLADNFAPINAALDAANGGDVIIPVPGVFTIGTNIDDGLANGMGRLVGASYAYFTHFGNSADVPGSTDYSYLGDRATVIKCDGCNLIGAPDTGTVNASVIGEFKGIKNLVVWGVNSTIYSGIYCIPRDIAIEDSTILDFGWYGYVQRNGITTKFDNVGFKNNGWNKTESGVFHDPVPVALGDRYTYDSGCQMKFISNENAGDYTTIDIAVWGAAATRRPTTVGMSNVFLTGSTPYLQNFSGIRGIQAMGVRSFDLDAVGSYFGNYFPVCSETVADCFHGETLTTNGAANSDGTPVTLALIDSATQFNEPILSVFPITESNSGATAVSLWKNKITKNGRVISGVWESLVESEQPIKNNFGAQVAAAVGGGGIDQLTWTDVIPDGFTGLLTVNVTYTSSKGNLATAVYLISRNGTAVSSFQVATNPSPGGYSIEVTDAQPNIADGDLTVDITFGASWGSGGAFNTYIGLTGMDSTV